MSKRYIFKFSSEDELIELWLKHQKYNNKSFRQLIYDTISKYGMVDYLSVSDSERDNFDENKSERGVTNDTDSIDNSSSGYEDNIDIPAGDSDGSQGEDFSFDSSDILQPAGHTEDGDDRNNGVPDASGNVTDNLSNIVSNNSSNLQTGEPASDEGIKEVGNQNNEEDSEEDGALDDVWSLFGVR